MFALIRLRLFFNKIVDEKIKLRLKKNMYLTVEDLMKKFKVGRTTVYKWMGEKRLKSVKIDGCRRFRVADVDAFEASLLCRTKMN